MIVLGLDGATFSLIEPWVASGNLPTFERLMEESVHGKLESTIPEITVPAWPAFATGRDPENLDMYGFTHFNRETHENDLSHDEFITGKMWDVVDDQGGSAVVFNIPGSYPWQAIDGTIIAAAPEYKEEYAHPPQRWEELSELVDGYKLRNDKPPGSREYVDLSLELVDKRFEGFEHFIRKEQPDLAVGLIRATDRVAHHYWGGDSVPSASSDNPLFEVYRRVDERLGDFLEAHEEDNVVIISDHGFEKVRRKFAVNVVLERAGLVSMTDSDNLTTAALGDLRDFASHLFERMGVLTLVRKTVPERVLTDIPTGDTLGLDNAISLGRIDWSETQAIADVGQKTAMIYVLENDPARIARIRDRAINELQEGAARVGLKVRFHKTGRGGPHTPDLCMVIKTPEVHASSRFDVEEVLFDVDTSGHAREGIFFARGPSFRDGSIEDAGLIDVAPTVLHALGYWIPTAMDGSVLDVFSDGSGPSEREPEYYEFVGADVVMDSCIAGDDDREGEVKDRLRELGYLE